MRPEKDAQSLHYSRKTRPAWYGRIPVWRQHLVPVESVGDITIMLRELPSASPGERRNLYNRLIPLLYEDLRLRARRQIGTVQRWDTLQPTALVHEAWERLLPYDVPFESRTHFLNVAAKTMRSLIVDRARKRRALKRGSGNVWNAGDDLPAIQMANNDPETLIWIDDALSTLSPVQIQLVELHFFSGHSFEETGEIMGLKADTVRARWKVIRLLLYRRLGN